MPGRSHPLALLQSPYDALLPVRGGRAEIAKARRKPGSALVWYVQATIRPEAVSMVADRPGGVALIMILPPARDIDGSQALIEAAVRTRPSGVLPFLEAITVDDLAEVLRRPPEDLPAQVTEYLRWRGLRLNRETVQLIRRTMELAETLRSVSSLARSLYMSRRALGRRFLTRGLPVPSHWLHFGRLLRTLVRLQNSGDSVSAAAHRLGYPDGFSLSNQMLRLTGFRPSDAREYLGWEWFLEAWLRREAESGGLKPELFSIRPPGAPVPDGRVRPALEGRTRSRGGRRRQAAG